ncbi:MAG: ABC transporter substrate-binding protein [Methanospirillum sp.]|uniref:ABC transporter substrate-binding protein n=1 Tax=Methanospirillum sp. TaxID=45200 RepID=UPI0023699554|nr:ABC transporter substrate-binding protein [Methanospirillum sp.]MDD1727632.1 ABC transporter substrate-binding protein [Methanospirillum sp.]
MNSRFSLFFMACIVFCIAGSIMFSPVAGLIPDELVVDYGQDSLQQHNTSTPIGVLVMQSGFVSDIGTEYSRAFSLAAKDVPGSHISQVIRDAGSNISVASMAWKNMSESYPDLPVIVTVASWTSNTVYPDASALGMVQVALGSALINRNNSPDHLIRFTPGVEQESPVLATYLEQFNRIVLLGGNNQYTNGYADTFEKLLPEKTRTISWYNPDDPKSTLNISEIREADPDAIVLLGFSEVPAVVRVIRDAGITAPLIGTRGVENNALAATKEAEGLIFTTPSLNRTNPFFDRYREYYHEDATFFGAEGYDAMTSLYSAVSTCGNSPDCICTWYQNQTIDGALGEVSFDNNGVASYPITFRAVRNGTFEDVTLPPSVLPDTVE